MLYQRHNGFTLTEVMMAVAVLAMVAAMAMPNLQRSRVNSNEKSVLSDIKTIQAALEMYKGNHNTYPDTLDDIVTSAPPYLDQRWLTTTIYSSAASPVAVHGYYIGPATGRSDAATFYDSDDDGDGDPATGTSSAYAVRFIPAEVGTTANKNYCLDHRGVIWEAEGDDPTIVQTGNTWACSGGSPIS